MSIKELYGYFYYAFYKTWLKIDNAFGATGLFPTDKKAGLCMFAVEVWLGFSIVGYIGHLFNIHVHISKFMALVPFVILFIINWFIFEKNDKWKNYVHEFNKWPKEKNRKGFWIVRIIILVIAISFFYIVHLLNPAVDQLKWK